MSYSVSIYSRGQNKYSVAQGPHHKLHKVSGVAQIPRYTKLLLSGRIFQGFRDYFPKVGQRSISLEHAGINYPNLQSQPLLHS